MKERNEFETEKVDMDLDFMKELSKYLDVLGSDTRLQILKFIEKEPKDIRVISSEIKTSRENTKRHLDKLLSVGVIKKEMGLGEPTVKGIHPVWKYSSVPGGLEAILRSLGVFSNVQFEMSDKIAEVKEKLSEQLMSKMPVIRVLGGADDGKTFPIKKDKIRIGRIDSEKMDKYDAETDVALSEDYRAVTRVSKPHAELTLEEGRWFIEDCSSRNGTFINDKKLDEREKKKLANGDIIGLAKGLPGVRLLFSFQSE